MMEKIAIVLAAGIGKRMHSKTPKVLHKICGTEMIFYPIESARKAGFGKVVVVISENIDPSLFKEEKVAFQKVPLGTGDAAAKGLDAVKSAPEDAEILILTGDNPLTEEGDIKALSEFFENGGFDAVVLSAEADNPAGLGRIISDNSKFVKIVEEKDATEEEKKTKEINTGIYVFKKSALEESLAHLSNNNAQGEYYLTDTLSYLKNAGKKVGVFKMERKLPVYGVNNRKELSIATKIIQQKILDKLMLSGVTILNPETVLIDKEVKIGNDTVIYPGTSIFGKTEIGADCEIGPNTKIENAKIGNSVKAQFSVILESEIGDGCVIGPFSYVRPGNKFVRNVKIGTFVEVKKSFVDENSKIPHLSYIGDATVGKGVNIGAGTITCNFSGLEGHKKNPTHIGDNVFIGSHTTLVAPVKIASNAYTAAGSVINKDVPEWTLAIGRAKQVNKENWVKRRKGNG